MNTYLLYSLCVLIWGSTWFVITYQLGTVPAEVSVFFRFALAALMSFALCLLSKKSLKFKLKDHFWFIGQGIAMFSMNYMLTYNSERYISSGLVAVTFTLMIYFNMFGLRIFFKQKINPKVILGAVVGGFGIGFLFYNEIASFSGAGQGLLGLALGIVASMFASAGNLLSVRNRKLNLPVMQSNAWGMMYGSLFTLMVCLILKKPIVLNLETKYLLSLFYLSFFGTIVAFAAYITILGRMGADRSAYVGIMTPALALILSTLFEGFHWTAFAFTGVLLSLLGNYLILKK